MSTTKRRANLTSRVMLSAKKQIQPTAPQRTRTSDAKWNKKNEGLNENAVSP